MSNTCARAVALTSEIALTLAALACTSGIDLAGMDRAVNPGDDFFHFANGTWERGTRAEH